MTNQPDWVCFECGRKWGHMIPTVATVHVNTCAVCHKRVCVTEARDFGYLMEGWDDDDAA